MGGVGCGCVLPYGERRGGGGVFINCNVKE